MTNGNNNEHEWEIIVLFPNGICTRDFVVYCLHVNTATGASTFFKVYEANRMNCWQLQMLGWIDDK